MTMESSAFSRKAYDQNNKKALEYFAHMASAFDLKLVEAYDDENKRLTIEAFKVGDVFFHDRRRIRIFRTAELEIRRTWGPGHWTLGNTIHVLGRKYNSPAAVYIQFSKDGKHAVVIRFQDQRKQVIDVENIRGDELMYEVNTYNAVFLVRTGDRWHECNECRNKWCDENETAAQRSIKRTLGVRLK